MLKNSIRQKRRRWVEQSLVIGCTTRFRGGAPYDVTCVRRHTCMGTTCIQRLVNLDGGWGLLTTAYTPGFFSAPPPPRSITIRTVLLPHRTPAPTHPVHPTTHPTQPSHPWHDQRARMHPLASISCARDSRKQNGTPLRFSGASSRVCGAEFRPFFGRTLAHLRDGVPSRFSGTPSHICGDGNPSRF